MKDNNDAIVRIAVLISMLVPYIGSMLQFLVFLIALCYYNYYNNSTSRSFIKPNLFCLLIPAALCGLAVYMAIVHPTDPLSSEILSVDEPETISFAALWLVQFVVLLFYLVCCCMHRHN